MAPGDEVAFQLANLPHDILDVASLRLDVVVFEGTGGAAVAIVFFEFGPVAFRLDAKDSFMARNSLNVKVNISNSI